MILSRRLFVSGGLAAIAAPAIVRAANIMPVRAIKPALHAFQIVGQSNIWFHSADEMRLVVNGEVIRLLVQGQTDGDSPVRDYAADFRAAKGAFMSTLSSLPAR